MSAPTRETGTAVVTMPAALSKISFKTDIERWAPQIEKVCYKGFTPDRVFVAAVDAAVKEPKIFAATPTSIYLALSRVARWGLDIGDTVYLVPLDVKVSKRGEPDRYATTVQAWPDYKGLKALAIREGIVRGMDEFVVYEGDSFDYQLGLDARLSHKPTSDPSKRGALVGAYTIIRLPYGERTFNYLPIADIETTRAKSKSWSPEKGYKLCPPWYAKKCAVRDYLNRQPKQGALREALAADDTEEETFFDPATGEVLASPAGVSETPAITEGDDDLELDRMLAARD